MFLPPALVLLNAFGSHLDGEKRRKKSFITSQCSYCLWWEDRKQRIFKKSFFLLRLAVSWINKCFCCYTTINLLFYLNNGQTNLRTHEMMRLAERLKLWIMEKYSSHDRLRGGEEKMLKWNSSPSLIGTWSIAILFSSLSVFLHLFFTVRAITSQSEWIFLTDRSPTDCNFYSICLPAFAFLFFSIIFPRLRLSLHFFSLLLFFIFFFPWKFARLVGFSLLGCLPATADTTRKKSWKKQQNEGSENLSPAIIVLCVSSDSISPCFVILLCSGDAASTARPHLCACVCVFVPRNCFALQLYCWLFFSLSRHTHRQPLSTCFPIIFSFHASLLWFFPYSAPHHVCKGGKKRGEQHINILSSCVCVDGEPRCEELFFLLAVTAPLFREM